MRQHHLLTDTALSQILDWYNFAPDFLLTHTPHSPHHVLLFTFTMSNVTSSTDGAPVNLLSLGKVLAYLIAVELTIPFGADGGGIRGLSELVILHEIMERVKMRKGLAELPKPCDYFHLIGGTGTGGYETLNVVIRSNLIDFYPGY